MVIGESQLQLPLYSRVDQPPGTKGTKGGALVPGVSTSQDRSSFTPGWINHPGLKVELQFSRPAQMPFTPGSWVHPGLKLRSLVLVLIIDRD